MRAMPLPQCVRADRSPGPEWREIGHFAVYERPVGKPFHTGFVRTMEHWEGPVIKAIAECFEHDRLHMDPLVQEADADAFKVDMVQAALDRKLPILTCGQPMTLGFLIVWPQPPIAHIELIGVAPDHRRQGIATALVASFLSWAGENGFEKCRAGTMEANPACCLYEAAGFKRIETCKTYHSP